jgi:hypothetical protein
VGNYELFANLILTMSRDRTQLFAQATGQPRLALYPKSSVEFFTEVVDSQITFETDSQCRATGLVLHQGGRDQRAPRIDDAEARMADFSGCPGKGREPVLPLSAVTPDEAAFARPVERLLWRRELVSSTDCFWAAR